MERTKAILAAGGLTVIVLISFLVFGLGNGRSGAAAAAVPAALVQPASNQAAADSAAQQSIAQWQAYSGQLEEAVRAMQVRELEYRAQLEAANQTIQQLQMQLSAQGRGGSFESHEGHDGDDL